LYNSVLLLNDDGKSEKGENMNIKDISTQIFIENIA